METSNQNTQSPKGKNTTLTPMTIGEPQKSTNEIMYKCYSCGKLMPENSELCKTCWLEKQFNTVKLKMRTANFPKEFHTILFDNYEYEKINWEYLEKNTEGEFEKMLENLMNTLSDEYKMILLLGYHGTGKTMLASWLASGIVWRGYKVHYTKQAAFNLRIRGSYAPDSDETEKQIYEKIMIPDLLVLDEIGSYTAGTDAERRYLQTLITLRHDLRKSMILVSNLDLKQFGEYCGSWVKDRLKENHVSILNFSGQSYRGTKP